SPHTRRCSITCATEAEAAKHAADHAGVITALDRQLKRGDKALIDAAHPRGGLVADVPHQAADDGRYCGRPRSRLPAPVRTTATPMPAHQRLGLELKVTAASSREGNRP